MSQIDRNWLEAPREDKLAAVECTQRACAALASIVDATDEVEVGRGLAAMGAYSIRANQLMTGILKTGPVEIRMSNGAGIRIAASEGEEPGAEGG